ncbi:ibr domain containing protein [Stylonychia lemnae]|uniref:RBR-type E3 ubiquitin transferase n=1 Tax=Stylonychia lemnae TaxID=5949 RepID=A0A078AYJ0_STYLE|nr:ibr domain containing protein [Stylonychia lemnae]|eukprot:CDW87485.1 ibr domain containing protein [Stylonychia lemnae]
MNFGKYFYSHDYQSYGPSMSEPFLQQTKYNSIDAQEDCLDLEFNAIQIRKDVKDNKKGKNQLLQENAKSQVLLIRNLVDMGYNYGLIKRLLCIHKINSVEQAVQLLSKDDIGLLSHPYHKLKLSVESVCYICHEDEIKHNNQNSQVFQHITSPIISLPRHLQTKESRLSIIGGDSTQKQIDTIDINHQSQMQVDAIAQSDSPFISYYSENIQNNQIVGTFECLICYDLCTQGQLLNIQGCGHVFCQSCVISYLQNLINTRQITKLVCPQYKCGQQFQYSHLAGILDQQTLEKFNCFNDDLKIMLDKNRVYCPNPKCNKQNMTCEQILAQEMGDWFTGSDFSNCPKCRCSTGWCWLCGEICSYAHFLPFNPMGCPGLIVSPSGRIAVMVTLFLTFLLLPAVMLICTMIFMSMVFIFGIVELNQCLGMGKRNFKNANIIIKILIVLVYIVEICIALVLSACISIFLVVLTIIPAYLFQIIKIIKTINHWINKSNDLSRQLQKRNQDQNQGPQPELEIELNPENVPILVKLHDQEDYIEKFDSSKID